MSRQRIETLRFASGDAEVRAALYDELGEALFDDPATVRKALERRLDDWGQSDEEEEAEGGPARKALPEAKRKKLLSEATWRRDGQLLACALRLREALGDGLFKDHNTFLTAVEAALKKDRNRPSAAELKLIVNAVSWRAEGAPPVIRKLHKPGRMQPDPLRGVYPLGPPASSRPGTETCVEYEPDSDLRDYEQVPLLEPGGVAAFIRREVLPYTPDAWIVAADTRIGYEISFTRHFYQPPRLRTLAEISADILALEQETQGLLSEITKVAGA